MIETPLCFADPPAGLAARSSPDALSAVLRSVRLTGAVFLNARLTAPFAIVSPRRYDDGLPMAHIRHISVFHLVAEGDCMIETARGAAHRLVAGDLLLLPFADRHRFYKGKSDDALFDPRVIRKGPIEGVWTASLGGGGAETRLVCGFLESAETFVTPVFHSLPELIIERAEEGTVGSLLAATVRDILRLLDVGTPGTQLLLGRLMELLFVEVLRRHASRLPADSTGLLAALNDPVVGGVLQLMHGDPTRRWTVEELARQVGASRSVVGERFAALLDKAPIEYLTGLRIQIAADRLRNGTSGIGRIAGEVGYESEAAFARAFKRVTGLTPGQWRAGRADSPVLMPLQYKREVHPTA
jgi:AraC-like DNA-binding protein